MNRFIFLLVYAFLLVSISYSQQTGTNNYVDAVIKDGKRDYNRETNRGERNSWKEKRAARGEQDIPLTTPHNRQLTPQEVITLQSIIQDFQVNEEICSSSVQENALIAMDGSGNFVIAWEDYRNANYDIYAQRYNSSGSALGTNFKVNDDTGSSYQVEASIAMDGSGNFVIAWKDYRNGYYADIYAQRYNNSGSAQGTNFKVNDDTGGSGQYNPSIAMDGSGNFVIAWSDTRKGEWDIYAQRYDSSGSAQGTNFKVNDDTGGYYQIYPSIAMDGSGNFVIAWEDDRNGDWDIYAQRSNSSGSAQGTNFKVNDDTGSSYQGAPSIAIDGSGNFVIAWQDGRNGHYDIYAQRYNSSGSAQGTNFKVNDDTGSSSQYNPSIAMDGSGNFVIAWEDYRNGDWDIYAQRYNSSGSAQGTNFQVNDDTGSSGQYNPSIAIDESGNFVIVWEDYCNCTTDIYARRYNSSGSAQGTNFQVNDDIGSSDQWNPSIAMDGSGNFVIVWEDYCNCTTYARRYNNSGSAQGTNFQVNDDTGSSGQYNPSIAMDGSGKFVIAWSDTRNGEWDIYAQRYDSSGSAQGTNFKVNDDTGSSYQGAPSIAIDGSGNFVIAWEDDRNGYYTDIYAQRYNSSGSAQGTNFKVNDDTGSSYQGAPSIAIDGSGNFVIAWKDYRNGYYPDIYAQRYNSSGSAQGTNFKVNDDIESSDQSHPSIAIDGSGNFVIAWHDERNGDWDIYARRYNSSGSAQGTNFQVNDDTGSSDQWNPSIAIDGSGNFVIAWEDYRNGDWDIYAQRYNSSGTGIEGNFRATAAGGVYHLHPAVKLWDGKIYNTWMSEYGYDWDIWANVLDWDNPVGIEEKESGNRLSVTSYWLGQNYPNPFNLTTIISFNLPKKANVILTIYSLIGKEIDTIVNKEYNSGYYEILFDASNLTSGLYLYKLEADDFIEVKKFVVLK
ncbi:MAG: T9SS type A sorting domain-containing protein [Candidatus Zhuqueibacterota bacterium]